MINFLPERMAGQPGKWPVGTVGERFLEAIFLTFLTSVAVTSSGFMLSGPDCQPFLFL